MKLFDHQCTACDGTGIHEHYYGRDECGNCDGLGHILTEEGNAIKGLIFSCIRALQRYDAMERERERQRDRD